jgi:uncharacterized protein
LSRRVVYVDSSALVKLVIREAESDALAGWIKGRTLVSSRLSEIEVRRTATRGLGRPWTGSAAVFDQMAVVELDGSIAERAAHVPPPLLRALDAIHLATALELADDLDAFVTYDDRLAEAARAAGMTVASPGAEEG